MEFAENLLILNLALCELVEKQQNEIALLKAEISLLKNPKNSKNSSIPPSKDENRVLPNQSLRVKSGKKVGGQIGHIGVTLEMSETPDKTIILKADFCTVCGNNLSKSPSILLEKRQVIDIPPVIPFITEYQKNSIKCSCGHCNITDFPSYITAPIQYGPNVKSLVVYQNIRQFMSFNRIREYFTTVYNINFSEGTIQNILKSMAQSAMPVYNNIKERFENAKTGGGDETSVRINGKKGWFWILQNKFLTYLICTDNRAYKTLEALFPKGLPNIILNHDAYSAWFQLPVKLHQLCLAHLQRDLNFFLQTEPCEWVLRIKDLFYEAIKWYENPLSKKHTFREQFLVILQNPPTNPSKKLNAFVKRLNRHQKSLFNFLDYKDVPPDNNGSERGIRNIKVKTKVSGQFKSLDNANIFAVLRSVIDTSIKNGKPILENLNLIAIFRAE